MKKRNNDSDDITDWTISKLKQEARAYDQTINEVGCYSMKDAMTLDNILHELTERGIEYYHKLHFK